MMVQCLFAIRTAIVYPQVSLEQLAFAAFWAFANNPVFDGSPNAALGLFKRVYFNAHLAFPYLFFRRPPNVFLTGRRERRPFGGLTRSPRVSISNRKEPANGSASISRTST